MQGSRLHYDYCFHHFVFQLLDFGLPQTETRTSVSFLLQRLFMDAMLWSHGLLEPRSSWGLFIASQMWHFYHWDVLIFITNLPLINESEFESGFWFDQKSFISWSEKVSGTSTIQVPVLAVAIETSSSSRTWWWILSRCAHSYFRKDSLCLIRSLIFTDMTVNRLWRFFYFPSPLEHISRSDWLLVFSPRRALTCVSWLLCACPAVCFQGDGKQ